MTNAGFTHYATKGRGKVRGKNACGAKVGLSSNNPLAVTCPACMKKCGVVEKRVFHAGKAFYDNGLTITWCDRPVQQEEIALGSQPTTCTDCLQTLAHAQAGTRPTPSTTAPPAAPEVESVPDAPEVATRLVKGLVHCVDGGVVCCTGVHIKAQGLLPSEYVTKEIGNVALVTCAVCRRQAELPPLTVEDIFFSKIRKEWEAAPLPGPATSSVKMTYVETCQRCEAIAKLLASFGVKCP